MARAGRRRAGARGPARGGRTGRADGERVESVGSSSPSGRGGPRRAKGSAGRRAGRGPARRGLSGAVLETCTRNRACSGLFGLSSETRVLLEGAEPRAGLAVDYFMHHVAKQIGAWATVLGGLDGFVLPPPPGHLRARGGDPGADPARVCVARREVRQRCQRSVRVMHHDRGQRSVRLGHPDQRGIDGRATCSCACPR